MTKVDFIWRFVTVIAIAVAFLISISACGKNQAPQRPDTTPAPDISDYKSYSNDGLTLLHPPHWTFEYDESPDLFADRGVSFRASETSKVDVLIFEEREISLADIADYVEKSLNLTSSDTIRDYQRKPLHLGNYRGIILRWRNILLIEYKVELSIFETDVSPKRVFTVFNFDEETSVDEAAHRVPFIESIAIQ